MQLKLIFKYYLAFLAHILRFYILMKINPHCVHPTKKKWWHIFTQHFLRPLKYKKSIHHICLCPLAPYWSLCSILFLDEKRRYVWLIDMSKCSLEYDIFPIPHILLLKYFNYAVMYCPNGNGSYIEKRFFFNLKFK